MTTNKALTGMFATPVGLISKKGLLDERRKLKRRVKLGKWKGRSGGAIREVTGWAKNRMNMHPVKRKLKELARSGRLGGIVLHHMGQSMKIL